MERIKRSLQEVPAYLGPARHVVITGLPPAADLDGQLRLEGLVCLLLARGLSVAYGRPSARPGEATIWLGAGEPDPAAPPLLLWPPADTPPRRLAAIAAADKAGRVCVADPGRLAALRASGARGLLLPDPSHALWGLLDQHPKGSGCLRLPREGWEGLLPQSRIRLLARLQSLAERGLPLAGPVTLARRRLIEAARRVMAAHAEVEAARLGPTLLAALLGRGIRNAGSDAVATYWAAWIRERRTEDRAA
ncbi:MAG: hypothetical protein QJR07_11805 [Acetobacteraceae bacterium]|nr:hypothetical protein [Acetobacteraceae bacterium]